MIDNDKLATKDEDIIAEAIEFRRFCIDFNSKNIEDARDDLSFLAGNQLDENEIASRKANGRPVIQINKLPTFLHQVTNDNLENTPSIKVHPVDNEADEEIADILSGLIKNIEYSSNADSAYDTAVNSAAAVGFGYFRLITDYCNDQSFDQEIKISRIANQFTVKFDYASTESDGSDAQRVLIDTKVERKLFKRLWPKSNIDDGFNAGGHEWISEEEVLIAEYYRIEYEDDVVVMLSNGEAGLKSQLSDQLPPGLTIHKERKTQTKKVMLYKLTSTEILERTEIKCDWIPVFPVYGNEINIDGKVYRSGIIRNAKDPAKMYSYFWNAATEEIASRSKTPWIMAEGQDEGYENDWDYANRTTKPRLVYKPTTFQGQLVPPPQRNSPAEFPSGFMAMAMHANDDIKATTGLFDSSLGAKGNATSGRQELAQQRQGDLANAHYSDALNKAIRHCGRCIVSMIPYYYDAPRIVRTIGEDGSVKNAEINKPLDTQEVDEQTGAIKTILNDLTVGKYDVTISTGPSYQTQRIEAAESMLQMAQSYPELMQVAGDKVIRALDWPNADEIADRVKRTIPPEFTKGEDDEDEAQLPPEAMQAMQQDHEQMLLIQQQMQELQMQLEAESEKAAKAELEKQRLELQAQSKLNQIEARNIELEIELQKANALDEINASRPPSDNAELAKIETARIDAESQERMKLLEIAGQLLASQQQQPAAEPQSNDMSDAMAQNMLAIQQLAEKIARPKQSMISIKKQPDGSFMAVKLEDENGDI